MNLSLVSNASGNVYLKRKGRFFFWDKGRSFLEDHVFFGAGNGEGDTFSSFEYKFSYMMG